MLALNTDKVFIHYQPQYNHATGDMVGAEALMRWREDGIEQSPSDFIPVLEETGLIHEADLHVFEMICRFLRKCLDRNISVVPISFNISRHDLVNHDYVSEIEDIRNRYQIPASLLRAEITESSTIGGMDPVTNALERLHECGYVVEMDDFGNGYSSLNVLKDLPVDVIKLDMRFLSGTLDGRGGLILNSIIQMTKWLETPLIAEGVETINQAEFMKSMGCRYIQGYLYAKPMPENMFLDLLKSSSVETISSLTTENSVSVYRFLDPSSPETDFFNTYAGPAVICSYENGMVNIMRANDRYFDEIGMSVNSDAHTWTMFDVKNKSAYIKTIEKAIESKQDEICEIWMRQSAYKRPVCIRCYIRVIGSMEDKIVLYVNIRNITAEKKPTLTVRRHVRAV